MRIVEAEDLVGRILALEESGQGDAGERIIRLESAISTGLEAELASMSDEEIEQEIAELSGVSVEELRARTPEERQRRHDEIVAALSEADVLDLMRQAPSHYHGLQERWRAPGHTLPARLAAPRFGSQRGGRETRASCGSA